MEKKVDLNNLKAEIDNRKKSKNIDSNGNNTGTSPKNQFLHGLLEAINTGRGNTATSLINIIENKVDLKDGIQANRPVTHDLDLLKHVDQTPTPQRITENRPIPKNDIINESPERDNLLYAEMERRLNEYKTLYPKQYENVTVTRPQQQNSGSQLISEDVLRAVADTSLNYIKENYAALAEKAMSDAIIEMFAIERIKKVLNENEDIIEKVVISTLRKLQDKQKNKPKT